MGGGGVFKKTKKSFVNTYLCSGWWWGWRVVGGEGEYFRLLEQTQRLVGTKEGQVMLSSCSDFLHFSSNINSS